MRGWGVLGAVVVIVAALATTATSAPTAHIQTIDTRGEIEVVAADGRLVAYDVHAAADCNRIHVLDLSTGRARVVTGPITCEADSTSTGGGVRELVLAGSRLAWIVNLGGNTESADTLLTARLGTSREHVVASALRVGDADGELNGGRLANLAGDGDLLVLNRWKTKKGVTVSATIRRLTGGLTRLHTGNDSLDVQAVDSGRIAVLEDSGAVTIRDAEGAMLSTFTPVRAVREVALRKDYVVALEPRRLDVRRTTDGEVVRTIAIPPGARDLDIHANIATFVVGSVLYGVRLATGRRVVLATAPKAIVDAQIDDAGVVYAFNRVTGVDGRGTLVVVPLSLVQARFA